MFSIKISFSFYSAFSPLIYSLTIALSHACMHTQTHSTEHKRRFHVPGQIISTGMTQFPCSTGEGGGRVATQQLCCYGKQKQTLRVLKFCLHHSPWESFQHKGTRGSESHGHLNIGLNIKQGCLDPSSSIY